MRERRETFSRGRTQFTLSCKLDIESTVSNVWARPALITECLAISRLEPENLRFYAFFARSSHTSASEKDTDTDRTTAYNITSAEGNLQKMRNPDQNYYH